MQDTFVQVSLVGSHFNWQPHSALKHVALEITYGLAHQLGI
jgi:hypothetical protein